MNEKNSFYNGSDTTMNKFVRYAEQRKDQRLKVTVRDRIVKNRLTYEGMVRMGMNITQETYVRIVVDDPVRPMPVKKLKEVHQELEKYNIPMYV